MQNEHDMLFSMSLKNIRVAICYSISKRESACLSFFVVASIQKTSSIPVRTFSRLAKRYVTFRCPDRIIESRPSLIPIFRLICFCFNFMIVNLHKEFTNVKHKFTICEFFYNHTKLLHIIYIDLVN